MVMMNALRFATRVAPRAFSRVSAPTFPRISSSECISALKEGKLDVVGCFAVTVGRTERYVVPRIACRRIGIPSESWQFCVLRQIVALTIESMQFVAFKACNIVVSLLDAAWTARD